MVEKEKNKILPDRVIIAYGKEVPILAAQEAVNNARYLLKGVWGQEETESIDIQLLLNKIETGLRVEIFYVDKIGKSSKEVLQRLLEIEKAGGKVFYEEFEIPEWYNQVMKEFKEKEDKKKGLYA